jgi:NAD(P)-dependent dehydrogenase (short-subunit alcohol dehydrogenase family)
MLKLRDTVAVVTGASRGAGRGIALSLGERGATVYVTGRSVAGRPTTDGMPGTIDETAEAVTERGGLGMAVRCDHTVDAEVEALFARVNRERGRLDVLVNCAWGGYEVTGQISQEPFWQQPMHYWDRMFVAGVRATLVSSRFAAPLMLRQNRGLIVNITGWVDGVYLGNVFYDAAKSAINRITFGMAQELERHAHGIAAVALTPGFIRTERVVAAFDSARIEGYEHFTESPEYVGRAVAALAADSNVLEKSGRTLTTGDLAREYEFTDVDGRLIPAFKMPESYPYK